MKSRTLYSFDVFDTCITRTYAMPADLHVELGEQLRDLGVVADANAFVALRHLSERDAWQAVGYHGAISIDLIYDVLANRLGWTEAVRSQALAAEVALEKAAARPVPSIAAAIRSHRADGHPICFVSDMHLHAAQVRDVLGHAGIDCDLQELYVSSDWGVTKLARGRLFRRMLRARKIPGWRVLHVGDSSRADVLNPRLHLIRTRHFPSALPTPREHALLQRLAPEARAFRKLVVASKFSRLKQLSAARVSPALAATLSDVVCPFVVAYALWLLAQARKDGVSRLFFLARDMQLVCEVTALLARQSGANVECVYALASRAAWQPAAFDGAADLFWLTDQLQPPTLRAALLRMLEPSELTELERLGVQIPDTAEPGLERSLRTVMDHPACRRAVDSAVVRRRALLLDYLDGCGFRAGPDCALVDAGWRGSLQRALSRALASAGRPATVRGYYIGLRHVGEPVPNCPMTAMLEADVVESRGYALVALLETLLTADHGTTLGYRRDPVGRVQPVLSASPPAQIRSQVAAVRESCLGYTEELIRSIRAGELPDSLPRVLAEPFLDVCSRPTRAEARVLGAWLFDAGREEPRLLTVASALNWRDFAKIAVGALRRQAEADLYLSGPWVRGSLALTNPLVAAVARRLLDAFATTR